MKIPVELKEFFLAVDWVYTKIYKFFIGTVLVRDFSSYESGDVNIWTLRQLKEIYFE